MGLSLAEKEKPQGTHEACFVKVKSRNGQIKMGLHDALLRFIIAPEFRISRQ